ncbi:MAG: two-component system, LuxR family, sensor kinase FixL [Pyrinomonadaceae bacterium]|jgi:PAS domain S-box-containing protein|nr:two-component system, LuxR family, sensor kinase FixL [Pyrinomonadaceae bacterium]MDQ1727985.1 two-component system, LuxR family, sensor kinase FixL [Pyrinomonadaceae bacterium]
MIAEKSKQESRHDRALDYFQNIVETVREPLVILDSDLRVTGASRSFYNTFSVTKEETEGRLIYELGDRQWDIPALRTLLEEILPEHTEFNGFEVDHLFPRVGRRVILLNARQIVTEKRSATMILLAIEDITDRKRQEQFLRESEERLQTIIENLHEGLVISDLHGQVPHFNHAGLAMHGFSSKEEGLLKISQFHEFLELSTLDGSVLAVEAWPLARVIAGEVLTDYEVCLRRIDTDWQATFRYNGAIVKAPNGQPLAFLTITDITKRKRIEAKLKSYSAKLERSNSELQDFAQIASHDLQEPLRKILAFGERLKAKAGEALDAECQDYLQRMFNAAGRMQTLINDLLTFSQVETQAQVFDAVNLGVIAREVSNDLEALIEQSGGRVEIGELPTLAADPVQMRQLLQNLIGNALKYCRAGVPPEVRISSEELTEPRHASINNNGALVGKLIQVSVADNGIGFDEKYLDRIFNMFQRLHKKGEYEGTGVGLAICRKIVDRHSGTITARSSPGQGTTFVVTMPVTQPKEVELV